MGTVMTSKFMLFLAGVKIINSGYDFNQTVTYVLVT